MPGTTRVVQPFYWLLGSAAAVVVIAGLRAAQSLVVPFLVAAFLAVICTPALQWLQKKRVPSWLAIGLVGFAISLVVLLIVGVVTGSVNGFINKVPEYQQHLQEKQKELTDLLEGVVAKLTKEEPQIIVEGESADSVPDKNLQDQLDATNAISEESVEPVITESSEEDAKEDEPTFIDHAMERFSTTDVLKYVGNTLLGLTGIFSNVFLVLLTMLFILLESSGFPRKLRALSRGAKNLDALAQAEKVRESIVSYMSLKTMLSLLTSVLVGILVWFLDIDFPILWAMLAFFLNFIPNIGSIMAAILPVLLAFIQFDLKMALIAAAGYLAINVVIGNFLEPRIMGKGLGLSTLVVFISLVFWGWVLGPVGMLFSVPLTMIVKIIMENFEETRWLAVLVGTNPEASD